METQEKTPLRDVFLRTIAVLGLIAILILGAWGIIQLAVALPGLFGNIGGGISSTISGGSATETLIVSAPSTLASGDSLTVSWNHQNGSGNYSYSISYACATGLSMKAPLPTGAYQAVPCNTPFDFVNATAHMTLIPTLAGATSQTLTLSVASTNLSNGAVSASGSAQTTITSAVAVPTTAPAAVRTSASASRYYPATTRAALYGYPDLAVQILSAVPNGASTQVQFVIVNDGTNIVPSGWNFNANLPINGSYTFMSQPQQALYPGDKIVYTLSFNNTTSGYSPYTTNYGNYYTGSGYTNTAPTVYPYTSTNYPTCNMCGPCAIPGYQSGVPNNSNANCNYGYGYNNNSYGYGNGTVTITVDPYNRLIETTKTNNSASISVPIY